MLFKLLQFWRLRKANPFNKGDRVLTRVSRFSILYLDVVDRIIYGEVKYRFLNLCYVVKRGHWRDWPAGYDSDASKWMWCSQLEESK